MYSIPLLKRFNYQYYEIDEIQSFLEQMAEKGYGLAHVFSGFFSFTKSSDKCCYHVVNNLDLHMKAIQDSREEMLRRGWVLAYSDRYVSIYRTPEGASQPLAQGPSQNLIGNRKYIFLSSSLLAVLFLAALLVNYFLLDYIGKKYPSAQLSFSYFSFGTAVTLFINYLIFYIGEAYDYFFNTAVSSSYYKRTSLKNTMFAAGTLLETIWSLLFVGLCIYSLAAGISLLYIAYMVVFLMLFLLQQIYRYNRKDGCYFYFSSLGFAAVLISIIEGNLYH